MVRSFFLPSSSVTAAVTLLLLLLLSPPPSSSVPFDLAVGGVYDNSEARSYFSGRFGADFFAGLADRLRGAAAAAAANDRNDDVRQVHHTPVFQSAQDGGEQQQQQQQAEDAVLYRDAVAPKALMSAADVQPRLKQDDLDDDDYYYDGTLYDDGDDGGIGQGIDNNYVYEDYYDIDNQL